jgi:hypothetical protein
MSRIEPAYTNIAYGLVMLLALAIVAFSPAYFMVLDTSLPMVMHIHAVLMFLWMFILIAQPILIKKKQFRLHRITGKVTYGLVPLLLLTGYAMIRYAYGTDFIDIPRETGRLMTSDEIVHQARIYIALPLYYFFAFIVFFSLGVIYRKNPLVHAKYMIATALSVTGPIIDRVFYYTLTGLQVSIFFPLEYVAFLLIDVVIIWLLFIDVRRNYNVRPSIVILTLYGSGQILYYAGLESSLWQTFAGWILFGVDNV